MNIPAPKREALYCHLTKDAKEGLTQLAKYHNTTLTNLVEEGAHMVIRAHLKQIHARNYNTQTASALNTW
jgi:hypothetical protein